MKCSYYRTMSQAAGQLMATVLVFSVLPILSDKCVLCVNHKWLYINYYSSCTTVHVLYIFVM